MAEGACEQGRHMTTTRYVLIVAIIHVAIFVVLCLILRSWPSYPIYEGAVIVIGGAIILAWLRTVRGKQIVAQTAGSLRLSACFTPSYSRSCSSVPFTYASYPEYLVFPPGADIALSQKPQYTRRPKLNSFTMAEPEVFLGRRYGHLAHSHFYAFWPKTDGV